jgi:hypothetical protein
MFRLFTILSLVAFAFLFSDTFAIAGKLQVLQCVKNPAFADGGAACQNYCLGLAGDNKKVCEITCKARRTNFKIRKAC